MIDYSLNPFSLSREIVKHIKAGKNSDFSDTDGLCLFPMEKEDKKVIESNINSMIHREEKMTEKWVKKCKCGSYIPDGYDLCDACLLDEYELVGRCDSDDWGNAGPVYYEEDDIIDALRKAEKKR